MVKPRPLESQKQEARVRLEAKVEEFEKSGNLVLVFPPSLSTFERMIVHQTAEKAGLLHESSGRGEARKITIRRKDLTVTEKLEKYSFRLKISLEEHYNLSDLLPVVPATQDPQFRITFLLDNIVAGVVPFEGLNSLHLPLELPDVDVSLQKQPGTSLEMRTLVSLNGKAFASGTFLLPEESGSHCTTVHLDTPGTFEDELTPGTQPPALKVCFSVHFSSPSSLSPTTTLPAAGHQKQSSSKAPEKVQECIVTAQEQQVILSHLNCLMSSHLLLLQVAVDGGVRPVFSQVLAFKTKKFPCPLRVQYLGMFNGDCLFSDGVHSLPVKVGRSYTNLFTTKIFQPLTIFTVLECTRGTSTPFEVFFSNLVVAPKNEQVDRKLGMPRLFGFH